MIIKLIKVMKLVEIIVTVFFSCRGISSIGCAPPILIVLVGNFGFPLPSCIIECVVSLDRSVALQRTW